MQDILARGLPIDIANNAFKRAAYGLIDYYLEEERELRIEAAKVNMDPKALETKIDALWGKVTLYNCYQMFVQLTSKKMQNPANEFAKKAKNGEYSNMSNDDYNKLYDEVLAKSTIWEDKPEADLLTLYFNATNMLPNNQMRELARNADNALRSMGGAEKMMASVYGIAITAMVRLVRFVNSKLSLILSETDILMTQMSM